MAQNTSSAVMQQRSEPHDSLDDFPTPPWATRALLHHVISPYVSPSRTVWEPACNRGHMTKPLQEYFGTVYGSDIHPYGVGAQGDFLIPGQVDWDNSESEIDWIITNPPFRLAEQFIQRAHDIKPISGVAIIVRSAFLEGVGRYKNLFSVNPPNIIAQFSERVVMVKGRLEPKGSTATAYCWLVWLTGRTGTEFQWIAPCRKQLERAEDYE